MSGAPSKLQLLFRSAHSPLLITSESNIIQQTLRKQVSNLQRTYQNSCRRQFSTSSQNQKIFSSKVPDIDIKNETLTEYLFPRMREFGDTIALVDFVTSKTYSYAELKTNIIKVASALNRLGYKKGDTISIFAANCPEYAFFLLACVASGIVLTSANPAYTSGELSRHLTHSESCALVVHQPLVQLAKYVISSEKTLKTAIKDVFVIGEAEGCRPFTKLLEDDGKSFPENVDINPTEDTAVMPYSSGTTGLPKGVMLSHMNIVSNLQQFRPLLRVTPDDTSLGILPFYHGYGMIPVMMGVFQDGGKLVTVPKFDPETFLKALATHRVTQLHVVPPIIVFMAKHAMVNNYDLSSLNKVLCGAAPLGESLTRGFVDRLKTPLTQGYGLTEASPVVTIDPLPPTYGSTGVLIPNTQAKIVCSETERELDVGETGELCFKGPQVMKGYFNNEKATKDMIRDEWLFSGDVGHVDEEGHFYVTDRLKELIKFKGHQVAPAELEDLLLKHPGVQDVAVIGVPDEDVGELPRAYVVPKTDPNPSAENILQFVEENAAPYKKLRGGVEFLKEIPKSPSGKILRRILRDRLGKD